MNWERESLGEQEALNDGPCEPPEGWTKMRCGAWVKEGDMMRHARTCRRCRDDEAADRADMAHSDGEV